MSAEHILERQGMHAVEIGTPFHRTLQGDCFCIFNTGIRQVTTETVVHRFLTIIINEYHADYWFFYYNITFLKEYFSTKISIVKKFLIISDNLSEKRNVYNNYFLL